MKDNRPVFKTIRNSAIIKNPILFEAIGLAFNVIIDNGFGTVSRAAAAKYFRTYAEI